MPSIFDEILASGKQNTADLKIGQDILNPLAPTKSIFEIVQEQEKQKITQDTPMLGGEIKMTDKGVVEPFLPEGELLSKDTDISLQIGTLQTTANFAGDFTSWVGERIKLATDEDVPYIPDLIEKFTDKPYYFIADKLKSIGDKITKKSNNTIKELSEEYSQNQKEFNKKVSENFEYKDVLKPEFWRGSIAQQVPSLALYFVPGMAISKLEGLGILGKAVLGGFINRTTESLQNASGTYRNVLEETKDGKKANSAAEEVVKKSLPLYGQDVLQFALDFLPVGSKGVFGKVIKFVFSAGTEIGEENWQNFVQINAERKAEGKRPMTMGEYIKSNEQKLTTAISGTLGGAGNIVAQFGSHAGYNQDKGAEQDAEKNLTPEQKEVFDKGFEQGKTKLENTLQDIKNDIKTPEEDKIVKEALNEKQLSLFNSLPESTEELGFMSMLPEKKILSPITPITKKQSNLLNQKLKTGNIAEYTASVIPVLEEQGYTVEQKTSGKAYKGSKSQYLFISDGSRKATVRVSDHALPKTYVDEYGMPDHSIDINGDPRFPFENIFSTEAKQDFSASEKLQDFLARKDSLSDAEVVQFGRGIVEDEKLNEAIDAELTKRGITDPVQIIALGEEKIPEQKIDTSNFPTKQDFIQRSQGFTYDVQNKGFYEAGKTPGIVVTPFPNRSLFIPGDISRIDMQKKFRQYVRDHSDLIIKGLKAGGFYSESRNGWVLDVGIVLPISERELAISLGTDTNQEGIFDMSVNPEEGYIPTGGTGLTPENFDEMKFFNIISPYISQQPSYETTSNTTVKPEGLIGGTTGGDLMTDVGQNVLKPTGSIFEQIEKENASGGSGENQGGLLQSLGYNKQKYTFEEKSGYKMTGKEGAVNIAAGIGLSGAIAASTLIPFIGPGVALTVGVVGAYALPATWFPKIFDTIFLKRRVLDAFRDTKTGITVFQLIENRVARKSQLAIDFINTFLGKDVLQRLFTNDVQNSVAKAYDIIWENIDTILQGETQNILTGQPLTMVQKIPIKNIFKAALTDYSFDFFIFDQNILWTIKKFMAVENIIRYYPDTVKDLLKKNLTEEEVTSFPTSFRQQFYTAVDRGYNFGFDELVKSGALTEDQRIPDYQRQKVLRDTYKNDIKRGFEDDFEGYDSVEELLAAKKIEYEVASGARKASLENEIRELETSIQKDRSADSYDIFRVHSPLIQFLDYAAQYALTITRKEQVDILKDLAEIAPYTVGTKKIKGAEIFSINMIDDIFFPNKVKLPSFREIQQSKKLYGQEYINLGKEAEITTAQNLPVIWNDSITVDKIDSKGNVKKVRWSGGSITNKIIGLGSDMATAIIGGAYFIIPGPAKQIVQGINSVFAINSYGILKSFGRSAIVGVFKSSHKIGEFFLKNRLSNREVEGKSQIISSIRNIHRTNKEMKRFGVNGIPGNNQGYASLYGQVLFGGPAEISIIEHVILNDLYTFVTKKTKKTYRDGMVVNTDEVLKDFEVSDKITQAEREKMLSLWRTTAQSLIDGKTQTGSGIAFTRTPFTKFFSRFVVNAASQGIHRISDMRSLLIDVLKTGDIKKGWKEFMSDKNEFYRQATSKMLTLVITSAIIIQAIKSVYDNGTDDEDKKKANTALAYLQFMRAYGISLQEQIIGAYAKLFSTPVSFYDQILWHADNLVLGLIEGNKTKTEVSLANLLRISGMLRSIESIPFVSEYLGDSIGMTQYFNIKDEQNRDWNEWFHTNVSRFYTTANERANVFQKMGENPNMDFNGMYQLMQLARSTSDIEYDNLQNGLVKILLRLSPTLTKTLLPKSVIENVEKYMKGEEEKFKTFNDVGTIIHTIKTAEDQSFSEIIVASTLAIGASNKPNDSAFVSDLYKRLKTLIGNDRELTWMLSTPSYKPFNIALSEFKDGKKLFDKIQQEPIIYAQVITAILNYAEASSDIKAKEKTRQIFSGDVPLGGTVMNAIAYHNNSPIYQNIFIDTVERSFGGTFSLNNGTKEQVEQKLATLETFLRIGAKSDLTSEASLRGMQILLGDKMESQITDLYKMGIFDPIAYPMISEALEMLLDARGEFVKPKIVPKSLTDVLSVAPNGNAAKEVMETNIEKKDGEYGVVTQYGLPFYNQDGQWLNGVCFITKPNAAVFSPYPGRVVETSYIYGLGHQVKIQDKEGNVMMYSNLDGYNLKVGDYVEPGIQFGKSQGNGLQCTLFNNTGIIETPEKSIGYLDKQTTIKTRPTPKLEPILNSKTEVLQVPKNSVEPDKWILGTTPLNEIIEKILKESSGKIDFSKLIPTIQPGQTTTKQPSVMGQVNQSKRPSVLEEILKNF